MKKVFKHLAMFALFLSISSNFIPAYNVLAEEYGSSALKENVIEDDLNFSDEEMNAITENGKYSYDEEITKAGLKLQKYFEFDENRNVVLNATKEQLMNDLNITETQALDLLSLSEPGVSTIHYRGFVGVYVHLGPKVRAMNGWAAAAFAGGYVGWYTKQLAAAGPWGAGAATLITASAAAAVKWAVENGIRTVPIGSQIRGYSLSYNVYVP
ncbi:hypothetical protein [Streptococcus pluranimalium]|uniref:hypothetical protein n=1 Tax=Streptococcus pluranimalium TaxID=82348 RepID=UPI0039FCD7CC